MRSSVSHSRSAARRTGSGCALIDGIPALLRVQPVVDDRVGQAPRVGAEAVFRQEIAHALHHVGSNERRAGGCFGSRPEQPRLGRELQVIAVGRCGPQPRRWERMRRRPVQRLWRTGQDARLVVVNLHHASVGTAGDTGPLLSVIDRRRETFNRLLKKGPGRFPTSNSKPPNREICCVLRRLGVGNLALGIVTLRSSSPCHNAPAAPYSPDPTGSTGWPSTRTSKWRWGPVLRPELPDLP